MRKRHCDSRPDQEHSLNFNRSGPNPKKIGIFLEELGLPYKLVTKEMGPGPNGLKEPEFLQSVTLNGRAPAIDDKGFILWEASAVRLWG
jgi:glutathione S-transferase